VNEDLIDRDRERAIGPDRFPLTPHPVSTLDQTLEHLVEIPFVIALIWSIDHKVPAKMLLYHPNNQSVLTLYPKP